MYPTTARRGRRLAAFTLAFLALGVGVTGAAEEVVALARSTAPMTGGSPFGGSPYGGGGSGGGDRAADARPSSPSREARPLAREAATEAFALHGVVVAVLSQPAPGQQPAPAPRDPSPGAEQSVPNGSGERREIEYLVYRLESDGKNSSRWVLVAVQRASVSSDRERDDLQLAKARAERETARSVQRFVAERGARATFSAVMETSQILSDALSDAVRDSRAYGRQVSRISCLDTSAGTGCEPANRVLKLVAPPPPR